MTNTVKVSNKLEIVSLSITDPQVVAAARSAEADGLDLAEYITSAIEIGVKALLATGVSLGIEVLADGIERAKSEMADATKKTTEDINKGIISMVGPEGALVKSINTHLDEFAADLEQLTGGEKSPIREGIQKQLEAVAKKLTDDFTRASNTQKDEIAKILDPQNPTSPLRQLGNDLREVSKVVNQVSEKMNQDVVVGEIISDTPIGGNNYEKDAILALQRVAGFAGDDCLAVGDVTGRVPRSKKGDGVVDLRFGATVAARIVVECKDSDLEKREWIKEAEAGKANRAATGFIGLCKDIEDMPNKSRMMVLDAQSIVVAFDPAQDDLQILHLIYQVVKFNTMRATGNLEDLDIAEINKRLDESLGVLKRFDEMTKQISTISNSAKAIRGIADELRETIGSNITAIRKAMSPALEPLALPSAEEEIDLKSLEQRWLDAPLDVDNSDPEMLD